MGVNWNDPMKDSGRAIAAVLLLWLVCLITGQPASPDDASGTSNVSENDASPDDSILDFGAIQQLSRDITADSVTTGCSGETCDVTVKVTFVPGRGDAKQGRPKALVLVISGFLQPSKYYSKYAEGLAKMGMCVIQYDCASSSVPDSVELGLVDAALSWVEESSRTPGDPLEGLVDMQQIHAIGHSRGGKLAALLLSGWRPASSKASGDSRLGTAAVQSPNYKTYSVHRVLLLDPVDSSGGEEEPSAVEILRGMGKTAGVVAASVTGTCNPADVNFAKFLEVLSDDSPFQELDAGHMQFISAGPAVMAFYDLLCGRGSSADSDVLGCAVHDSLAMISNGTLPRRMPTSRLDGQTGATDLKAPSQ